MKALKQVWILNHNYIEKIDNNKVVILANSRIYQNYISPNSSIKIIPHPTPVSKLYHIQVSESDGKIIPHLFLLGYQNYTTPIWTQVSELYHVSEFGVKIKPHSGNDCELPVYRAETKFELVHRFYSNFSVSYLLRLHLYAINIKLK